MHSAMTKKDIIMWVKSRQISPEVGLQLLKGGRPQENAPAAATETLAAHGSVSRKAALDIAVIGLAGRYPGAGDVRQFWRNLVAGKSAIRTVPPERWDVDAVYDPVSREGYKTVSKWGGFVDGIDQFDSLFFNISPREAELMDPQQRLFLQEAWRALEDAGYHERNLDGRKCGVFVGCKSGDYQTLLDIGRESQGAFIFMGNNESILAARIAYLLNLRGPALAIDTACSSSLVSIHLACESLLSGTCEMAIAGGAALLTTPVFHVLASKAGMLSGSDCCKTFDNAADGFVPGEGVGAVVLKPLVAALRDGDQVYAVIKGSGINQDGRTNGITAPSAPSQTALEREVYDRCGVDPDTLSYVEAHGTGTKLGDPIEIHALTDSFRAHTQRRRFCAIGSVKTNIGHALASAGIAGFTKLLLQLRHRQLAPSLNFQRENEHIPFADSPFVVNTELRPWEANGQPRRAAISAFGFSGTNAHLVVEETPTVLRSANRPPLRLLAVSAKTEATLRRRAGELADWLESDEGRAADWSDVLYTLLARRSHFIVRAATVADNPAEAARWLRAVAEGAAPVANLKQQRSGAAAADPQEAEDAFARIVGADGANGESWQVLADHFRRGAELDWARLATCGFRCVSLPTYPFSDDRHWCAVPPESERGATRAETLHPLVHANVSTLLAQRYRSEFGGDEFYLRDHVVRGRRVLPGVAYLELARAAGELAGERRITVLRNVIWARPAAVDKNALVLEFELIPDPDGEGARFEVATPAGAAEAMVHCQGKLSWLQQDAGAGGRLDLAAIRTRLASARSGAQCYEQFARMGLEYGLAFRSIVEIYPGAHEALAKLQLPSDLVAKAERFVLNPSLLDGALQSLIGLRDPAAGEGESATFVPFSLDEAIVHGPLPVSAWALVQRADAAASSSANAAKFSVRIADANGEIKLELKGLHMRRINAVAVAGAKPAGADASGAAVNCYRPVWTEAPAAGAAPLPERVLLFSDSEVLRANLLAQKPGARVFLVKPGRSFRYWAGQTYEIDPSQPEHYRALLESLAAQGATPEWIVHAWSEGIGETTPASVAMGRTAESLLLLTQALLAARQSHVPVWFARRSRGDVDLDWHSPAAALARSAAAERPGLRIGVLDLVAAEAPVSDADFWKFLAQEAAAMPAGGSGAVRWCGAKREVLKPVPLAAETADPEPLVRSGGVYWITGGLGGIGRAIAARFAQSANVTVILTGRTEPTKEAAAWMEQLSGAGSKVLWLRADLTERPGVEQVWREIKKRHGALHGIVHAAGVTRDALIADKKLEDVRAVLGPKIVGTLLLDELTRDEPLDFFVVCAALAGVVGNPGQADYAYGNAFLDHFATRRQERCRRGLRRGKTCALDWPLWREGGMRMSAETEELLKTTLGMAPLETGEALKVLEEALRGPGGQIIVVKGDPARVAPLLGADLAATVPARGRAAGEAASASSAPKEGDDRASGDLRGPVERALVQTVSAILKVKDTDIELTADMSEFGFDSIGLTQFANRINERYGLEIMPSVFFEYPTLAAFAEFLCRNHAAVLSAHHGLAPSVPSAERKIPLDAAVAVPDEVENEPRLETWSRSRRFLSSGQPAPALPMIAPAGTRAPLAIIGASGRFPQSRDLQAFWENLNAGRDLITEVPPERWDWRAVFGDPAREPGRTSVKWGGFMPGVDEFDAAFFGISPREAELMDPQQRLFMQAVWAAIENAGYKPGDLAGTRTSLFAGVTTGDYLELLKSHEVEIQAQSSTGVAHSILVNRISFLLNLRGPSEPVDTACSSALVALHRAAESIWSGDCDLAIAGGVNAILTPTLHIGFNRAGMLAPDGRCKTFDQSANGYVRGEGVGVVLLKPLDRAIAAGDHIHAVLRGSAVNHGGRANSLTAPNPNAQAEVIGLALERAGLDSATIGYIEAHGTGTSLGDPIEINGLKKAFEAARARTGKPAPSANRCAVGSVKSNVGHLEAAAGMAGLFKVMLAFQHERLPATLHVQELNPYLQLEGSGFYVARDATRWEPLQDESGAVLPRRAGVSSFGFGGVNAHVVLEEYRPAPAGDAADRPQLVVLSAQTEERLRVYAGSLADYLEAVRAGRIADPGLTLARFAYTLQIGREAMDERLAFVATSLDDAAAKLQVYARRGAAGVEHGFVGNSRDQRRRVAGLLDGDEGREFLKLLRDRRRLDKLGLLWTSGAEIDWSFFHDDPKPRRVPLPTYPFAETRFWIPRTPKSSRPSALLGELMLPRSAGTGLVWTRSLRPLEALVDHHRVGGDAVLPAAAYVEMGLEAWAQLEGAAPARVRNITWLQPLAIEDAPVEARIQVDRDGDGVCFEVRSGEGDGLHCRAELDTGDGPGEAALDIATAEQRCQRVIDAATLREGFARQGIVYGEFYQGLREVRVGGDEALGTIDLPEAGRVLEGRCALHPAVLDAALQTIAGLADARESARAWLPFSAGEIVVLRPLGRQVRSYVKRAGAQRFHVALLDPEGRLCARVTDLQLRERRDPLERLFYRPGWSFAPAAARPDATGGGATMIVTAAGTESLADALQHAFGGRRVVRVDVRVLASAEFERALQGNAELREIYFLPAAVTGTFPLESLEGLRDRQHGGVHALLALVQALNRLGWRDRALTLVIATRAVHSVVPGEAIQPWGAELVGFGKSLAKEYPRWNVRCVDLPASPDNEYEAGADALLREPHSTRAEEAAWREGRRFVRSMEPIRIAPAAAPYRKRGVYLLLGGAGGLGWEYARHLASTTQARVALVGRREPSPENQARLAELARLGGEGLYVRADIADAEALRRAVADVEARFGEIHGVVHTAIVLKDATIERLDQATLDEVLAPKAAGSVALAQVLAGRTLDFVMFFSSAQSFAGNAGQANYAAACTFEDAYAAALRCQLGCPVKVINWGYWGSVGVVSTDRYQRALAQRGVQSITPAEGMEAVGRILASPLDQVMAIKADAEALSAMGIDLNVRRVRVDDTVPSLVAALAAEPALAGDSAEERRAAQESLERLHAWGRRLAASVLRGMGVFAEVGETRSIAEWAHRAGVSASYARLWRALVRMLGRAGELVVSGDAVTVARLAADEPQDRAAEALAAEKQALLASHPELSAFVRLLEACVTAYPDVLTGRRSHMEVMFPGGSMELVEAIYRGNRMQDACNRQVADLIAAYVERRLRAEPAATVRILEIGAGTGGTSQSVLAALRPFADRVKFIYTDVSLGFVGFGERTFGSQYSFAEFKALDIEKRPENQGFDAGECDLIFASNVLHATRHVARTLTHLKTLLKRGGVVVINELTQAQDFGTLTFGLTEGWWLFEDEEQRLPDAPVLDSRLWTLQLRLAGFEPVQVLGGVATGGERPQSVLIAESDGWVLLPQGQTSPQAVTPAVRAKPDTGVLNEPAGNAAPPASRVESAGAGMAVDAGQRVRNYLREVFSGVLKLPMTALTGTETFERFGVDSLVVLQLNERLEKDLGKLPATLLFEYTTIDSLAGHLLARFAERLASIAPAGPGALAERRPAAELFATKALAVAAATPPAQPSANAGSTPATGCAPVSGPEAVRSREDVAIVGVSGRYPLAGTVADFWANLREGRNCIRDVPPGRWDWRKWLREGAHQEGAIYTKAGGFIEGMEDFDPLFFHLAPKEAERMDPQERLFLQCAWETLEDAGLTAARREELGRRVGVFVGVMNGGYAGGSPAYWSIANRVSYHFNLSGPSFAVDSACSSSLTAIHLACESLRRGECNAALAGGVNVIFGPGHFRDRCAVGMLSRTDQCRAFGEGADGFVTGEGVGSVLLMPKARAEAMGMRIIGVIKASAINAGGKTSGYTVPNPNAQAAVVDEALRAAGIDPASIGYIEAHGTGTALGDPIEIAGLQRVFGNRPGGETCAVGSVKSNIGHLEAAAGVSALTKVLLQLEHRELVPSLHASPPNPLIRFEATPLRVQRSLAPWTHAAGAPRRACVSSFGAGGANAHLVVEEYCADSTVPPERGAGPFLFVLSAKSERRLQAYATRLAAYLRGQSALHAGDVARTLGRREVFDHRLAVIASDVGELAGKLEAFAGNASPTADIMTGATNDRFSGGVAHNPLAEAARAWIERGTLADALNRAAAGRAVWLPPCPFETMRLWLEPGALSLESDSSRERWRLAGPPADVPQTPALSLPAAPSDAPDDVREQLSRCLADQLGIDAASLSDSQRFVELGVDSIHAAKLAARLSEALRADVTPTVFLNFPTVGELETHLRTLPQTASAPRRVDDDASATRPTPLPDSPVPAVAAERDIAVIGVAGRFPGAGDVDQFWANLRDGVDSVREIPEARWNVGAFYDPKPNQPGKTVSKWAGLVDGVELFDAPFFDLMAMEAKLIDPQQRLFLEEAWRALESAGCTAQRLAASRCGVFVGCGTGDYTKVIGEAEPLNAFAMMGNHSAVLPARVSYFLNLRGPAVAIDTACSSSLVAIHQACQSLLSGESDLAVAGGAHLTLTPLAQVLSSSAGMLSPDGKCKTFDDAANGIVIGEGVGAVVLKPLAKARADGDRILAVIKASGSNQDGRTHGMTAPNARAQAALEEEVYRRAGINPETITYVETHGTGTKLGDPVEVEGLTQAFRKFTAQSGFCALASVKPNIGHAYQAAGIASFIKAVLALQHRQIPPSLHVSKTNEHLRLEGSPFFVNTTLRDWTPPPGIPRRVAVSSFGYSGTNAHVVLEEFTAPQAVAAPAPESPQLVVLSARTEPRLRAYAAGLRAHLLAMATAQRTPEVLRDIAHTLRVGRTTYVYRLALVVGSVDELIQALGAFRDRLADPARIIFAKSSGATKGITPPTDGSLLSYARAWTQGAEFDWGTVPGGVGGRLLPLPLPPLQPARCWPKEPAAAGTPGPSVPPAFTPAAIASGLRPLETGDDVAIARPPAALAALADALNAEPTVFLR